MVLLVDSRVSIQSLVYKRFCRKSNFDAFAMQKMKINPELKN